MSDETAWLIMAFLVAGARSARNIAGDVKDAARDATDND
jgi:hypothetical protein